MSETTPTPNAMPGATPPASPDAAKSEPKAKPAEPASSQHKPVAEAGLPDAEKAELERLRAIHKDETKWEKTAKVNKDAAPKMRALAELLGIEPDQYGLLPEEFDPKTEFSKLRDEVTKERTERLRSEVARTEEVDLDVIFGSTEEEMRESARKFNAAVEAAADKKAKGRAPAAVPASEVTSNGKVAGPDQIQSRDQLKTMPRDQIIEAHKTGRLDQIAGGAM